MTNDISVYKNVSCSHQLSPKTHNDDVASIEAGNNVTVEADDKIDETTPPFRSINFSSIYTSNNLLYNIVENLENSLDELIIHVKDYIQASNNNLDELKTHIIDETAVFKSKIDMYLS